MDVGYQTTRQVAGPGTERRRHGTDGQTGEVELNEPNSTASSNQQ
jgi:hypothetical protein